MKKNKYVVSYEYLSGADFCWHRMVEVTEQPVKKMKNLFGRDFGAGFSVAGPQVRNVTWEGVGV